MEYTIQFTLVGSDDWLTTSNSCELMSEVQMEERVEYIIGMKVNVQGLIGHAQKVKLYTSYKLIGESMNIREIGNFKLYI